MYQKQVVFNNNKIKLEKLKLLIHWSFVKTSAISKLQIMLTFLKLILSMFQKLFSRDAPLKSHVICIKFVV